MFATGAAEADDTEPIRIHFQAYGGCPDAATFTREVRARTARARLASEGERARSFEVAVAPRGSSSQGRLVIREEGGASSVREVAGRDCAEVVSALALIAALAIDPKASTAVEPPAPPPIEPPQPPPPPPAPPFFPPVAAPRGAAVTTPTVEPRAPWPPLAPPLPVWLDPGWRYDPIRYRITVGAQLAGVGAIAPGISPGILLFVDAAHNDEGPWAPSWRLSIGRAAQDDIDTVGGIAAIRWFAGRAEACPVRLGDDELGVRPCGFFELGALEAQGVRSVVRPWAALGLLGRVHWVLQDRVELEVQGGLNVPTIRDTFYFEGQTKSVSDRITVHATPGVGGIVGAGVGLRFP